MLTIIIGGVAVLGLCATFVVCCLVDQPRLQAEDDAAEARHNA